LVRGRLSGRIWAIKIDAEGFESEILAGGTGFIDSFSPLIFCEGATDIVRAFLTKLDYCEVTVANNLFAEATSQSPKVNSLFIRADRRRPTPRGGDEA
jgi:hypothetical protein